MTNIERIEKELNTLLARINEDAFVIIEEVLTKKFVQFSGNKAMQLLLDLPSQTLNKKEIKRAETLFIEFGLPIETYPTYNRPGGKKVALQRSFIMELGNDTRKAALIAMRIFKEVYGFSDSFNLAIEEN